MFSALSLPPSPLPPTPTLPTWFGPTHSLRSSDETGQDRRDARLDGQRRSSQVNNITAGRLQEEGGAENGQEGRSGEGGRKEGRKSVME